MALSVTGILSQVWRGKQLLAASATYQSLVDAADATEALDTIHAYEVADSDFSIPCARVDRGGDWMRGRNGIGLFKATGSIVFDLWFVIPDQYGDEPIVTRSDQIDWVDIVAGQIIGELESLQGTGQLSDGKTHLSFTAITVTDGPFLPTEEETGDLYDPDEETDAAARHAFIQLTVAVQ